MPEFTTIISTEGGTKEYGLRILFEDGSVREYRSLSPIASEAERLRDRLSDSDVSPVHYDDVVRDYILETAYERIDRNRL